MIKKQKQNDNGRAFEYAVATTLAELSGSSIITDISAEESFGIQSETTKINMLANAKAAITHILMKDDKLRNGEVLYNSNSAGQSGDVRDILIKVGTKIVGISCKNNHEALKHSRLSKKLDFITKWGVNSNGCSQTYWNAVNPVFDDIQNKKIISNGTDLWTTIYGESIGKMVYWPILDAWECELRRVYKDAPKETAKNILSYIVGKQDFYKVIRQDGKNLVKLQVWNFNKTLPFQRTEFPSAIIDIQNLNGGQYSKTIYFNKGYTINFRLHNAKSRLETSLKFDIQALGLPVSIYQQELEVANF